jgi:hypothetical protein
LEIVVDVETEERSAERERDMFAGEIEIEGG